MSSLYGGDSRGKVSYTTDESHMTENARSAACLSHFVGARFIEPTIDWPFSEIAIGHRSVMRLTRQGQPYAQHAEDLLRKNCVKCPANQPIIKAKKQ